MGKKKKKDKTPSEILNKKKNELNWNAFNFLENLLIFCVMKEKSVPKESGVHFRITPDADCEGLCILFEIDRQKDPLFEAGISRPDYMVLYADRNGCLCTIIEMKGRTEKGAKHGIEQIKVLRDRLREELNNNVTNKFKVTFQAILLTPYNADIPRNLIAEEKRKGLTILPLQYDRKAELFDYVSKKNEITERYKHKEVRPSPSHFECIENLLANYALPERIENCSFYSENMANKTNDGGLYINYCLPDEEGYSAFAIDKKQTIIALKEKENETKYQSKISEELNKLGENVIRAIQIKDIE